MFGAEQQPAARGGGRRAAQRRRRLSAIPRHWRGATNATGGMACGCGSTWLSQASFGTGVVRPCGTQVPGLCVPQLFAAALAAAFVGHAIATLGTHRSTWAHSMLGLASFCPNAVRHPSTQAVRATAFRSCSCFCWACNRNTWHTPAAAPGPMACLALQVGHAAHPVA